METVLKVSPQVKKKPGLGWGLYLVGQVVGQK